MVFHFFKKNKKVPVFFSENCDTDRSRRVDHKNIFTCPRIVPEAPLADHSNRTSGLRRAKIALPNRMKFQSIKPIELCFRLNRFDY